MPLDCVPKFLSSRASSDGITLYRLLSAGQKKVNRLGKRRTKRQYSVPSSTSSEPQACSLSRAQPSRRMVVSQGENAMDREQVEVGKRQKVSVQSVEICYGATCTSK